MIMCVLLCYPVSFHMLQLLLTGRPISSSLINFILENYIFLTVKTFFFMTQNNCGCEMVQFSSKGYPEI